MTIAISRQGLEQIALLLVVGLLILAVVAFLAHRRRAHWRPYAIGSGVLAIAALTCVALAYTVAPNIPTPSVPLTARFAQNPIPDTPKAIDDGRVAFQQNCAICHGARGLGDGPAAFTLVPRPVNLQVHVPQHASGEVFYWISEGIAGTPMAAWKETLSEAQRWTLVRYLQALAAGRAN